MLGTDSGDYELLTKYASMARQGPFVLCEIGVREGGSTELIIRAAANNPESVVIAIDRFGGKIPYELMDNHIETNYDYSNTMRNKALSALYKIADECNVNFMFYNLTDFEFFNRFYDYIPVYQNDQVYGYTNYNFIHFDGPHQTDALKMEIDFFSRRSCNGAYFVFDDYEFFNLDEIAAYLDTKGFVLEEKGPSKKVVFRKDV